VGTPAARRALARLAPGADRDLGCALTEYMRTLDEHPPTAGEIPTIQQELRGFLDTDVLDAYWRGRVQDRLATY